MKKHIMGVALLLAAGVANAAVVTYTLEDTVKDIKISIHCRTDRLS